MVRWRAIADLMIAFIDTALANAFEVLPSMRASDSSSVLRGLQRSLATSDFVRAVLRLHAIVSSQVRLRNVTRCS
jgi:hypothetical protein